MVCDVIVAFEMFYLIVTKTCSQIQRLVVFIERTNDAFAAFRLATVVAFYSLSGHRLQRPSPWMTTRSATNRPSCKFVAVVSGGSCCRRNSWNRLEKELELLAPQIVSGGAPSLTYREGHVGHCSLILLICPSLLYSLPRKDCQSLYLF